MSLRVQLLLVSLSLLILPWAVFLFVAELDRNLSESQLVGSQSRARAAAKLLTTEDWRQQRVRPESKTLLAAKLDNAILLDGYADDWSTFEMQARDFHYVHNKVAVDENQLESASAISVLAATRNGRLYLFVRVSDDAFVYHKPRKRVMANGDNVIIRVPDEVGNIRRYTFRWGAQGQAYGRYYGAEFEGERPLLTDTDFTAVMVETEQGYNVEMRMPIPDGGRFGLSVVDIDQQNGVARWTGMFNPGELDDVGQLKFINTSFNNLLGAYVEPGMRLRVFDGQGWLVADVDHRMPDADVRSFDADKSNIFDAVLYRFISWSLEKNITADTLPEIDSGKLGQNEFNLIESLATEGSRFLRDKYDRVFLTTLAPIEGDGDRFGYLLLQQPRAALTAFTETAMLRLVKIFGFAVLLVAAILLAFASLISWRVRRLRNDIESAISRDGKITGDPGGSAAADEIGDLSRSFNNIIARLGNYTGYLQTLGSKLSHELRTPLSVVTSSLENIDKTTLDDRAAVSIERAGQGAARLQKLIRNLSEASSLEETIGLSEKSRVDLAAWISVAQEVYADIYKERFLELSLNINGSTQVEASVELLHQMLDKLLSNAVDFSAPQSTITLGLHADRYGYVTVFVDNEGGRLPQSMGEELFEPMVSQRNVRDDQPHMGLGLYIVKLIAEYHRATVDAMDLPSRQSVRFLVTFPASEV